MVSCNATYVLNINVSNVCSDNLPSFNTTCSVNNVLRFR